ncbi:MAG: type I-E CRISPR-associated protein Cas7/Cse4/CasC [bacterium]
MSRFVQIHTLTAFPASLLNRDDAGYAKRLPFGGSPRIRISSQCLKRHWRTSNGPHALDGLAGSVDTVRSRYAFDIKIRQPLETDGVPAELAEAIAAKLQELFIGMSNAKKAEKAKKGDEAAEASDDDKKIKVQTPQVVILGQPELDYALSLAREIAARDDVTAKNVAKEIDKLNKGDLKKNLEALRLATGLNAALFGRMVTGDVLAHMDAAVHVAHAFTVHAEDAEPDYFSAVDDLAALARDDHGSGHINTAELTTGLFYSYVVVDVPLLKANLGGDAELAAGVVERLVHLITTESPGAKKGSTAPYARASMVLAELGDEQPRTLANAFFSPVAKQGDVMANAFRALKGHLGELDAMYGAGEARKYAAIDGQGLLAGLGERGTVPEVAGWLGQAVRG